MSLYRVVEYVYEKVEELAQHFGEDSSDISEIIELVSRVVRSTDTLGRSPNLIKIHDRMQEYCDDIETSVHQMEIHMLAIHRRLHSVNASIDVKMEQARRTCPSGISGF